MMPQWLPQAKLTTGEMPVILLTESKGLNGKKFQRPLGFFKICFWNIQQSNFYLK